MALAFERSLRTAGIEVPPEVLAAMREGRKLDLSRPPFAVVVEPIAVDENACANVPEGKYGAVLMKLDAVVRRAVPGAR